MLSFFFSSAIPIHSFGNVLLRALLSLTLTVCHITLQRLRLAPSTHQQPQFGLEHEKALRFFPSPFNRADFVSTAIKYQVFLEEKCYIFEGILELSFLKKFR